MKKRLFSVVAALFIMAGIGFNAYATLAIDGGGYYNKRNCWFNDQQGCRGSGSDCGLASKCY
jgi:hypothetical protein